MTFQVSDVQIVNRRLRRTALVHSVIAFFFNVFIIAISVSVAGRVAAASASAEAGFRQVGSSGRQGGQPPERTTSRAPRAADRMPAARRRPRVDTVDRPQAGSRDHVEQVIAAAQAVLGQV